ncbi:MAG: hypothetical protein ACK5XB_12505 [Rhodospirillales bacterium]|jgi:hypothetical protein
MPLIAAAPPETWRQRLADRDVRAGFFLASLGIGCWIVSGGLSWGSFARPGAGLLPGMAALTMAFSGVGLALWAGFRSAVACADPPIAWRSLLATLGSAFSFAFGASALGLAAGCIAAATCACMARKTRVRATAAIALTVGSSAYAVFGLALGPGSSLR